MYQCTCIFDLVILGLSLHVNYVSNIQKDFVFSRFPTTVLALPFSTPKEPHFSIISYFESYPCNSHAVN